MSHATRIDQIQRGIDARESRKIQRLTLVLPLLTAGFILGMAFTTYLL